MTPTIRQGIYGPAQGKYDPSKVSLGKKITIGLQGAIEYDLPGYCTVTVELEGYTHSIHVDDTAYVMVFDWKTADEIVWESPGRFGDLNRLESEMMTRFARNDPKDQEEASKVVYQERKGGVYFKRKIVIEYGPKIQRMWLYGWRDGWFNYDYFEVKHPFSDGAKLVIGMCSRHDSKTGAKIETKTPRAGPTSFKVLNVDFSP